MIYATYKTIRVPKNWFFKKFSFFHIFVIFFAFGRRSSWQFLPPLEPIDIKILPDGIFFETSDSRKWNKIEIWTDEPASNFDFKSLALPICCRLGFSKFPWHRITLRVGMMPSCSTSHLNDLCDFRNDFGEKIDFSKIFTFFTFFVIFSPPGDDLNFNFYPR